MKLPLDWLNPAATAVITAAVHLARAERNERVEGLHLLVALVRAPTPDVDLLLRHIGVAAIEVLEAATFELPPPSRRKLRAELPVAADLHRALANALAAEREAAGETGTDVQPIDPAHLLIGLLRTPPAREGVLRRRRPSRATVILGRKGAYAPEAYRWLLHWRGKGRLLLTAGGESED